jgi:superfamily II DNA or RNA helicase
MKLRELRDYQSKTNLIMSEKKKGIIVFPTGSGKTLTFMEHAKNFLFPGNVILIVSPRLLLNQQLLSEFDQHLHYYDFVLREVSSQSKIFKRDRKKMIVQSERPTTIPSEIAETYRIAKDQNLPLVLFSSFDSLNKVIESNIPISVAYFDEAHNCVKSNYFPEVKKVSEKADHCYFFTATPRYTESRSPNGVGMSNKNVYGEIIAQISFKYLVEKGYVVPPFLHIQKSDSCIKNSHPEQVDFNTIKENVEYYEENFSEVPAHKILYCMKGTLNIQNLLTNTEFQSWATSKGYNVLSVDSVNGGYVNGKFITKEKFIDELKTFGNNPDAKMLILHYEMISEGIDISGITGVCFLRNVTNTTFITQCIGRCIRPAGEWKKYGIVSIVQHQDDTDETCDLTKEIVNSLIEIGVPLDAISNDISGRGLDEEVIEDLKEQFERQYKEIELEWHHSQWFAEIEEMIRSDEEAFIKDVF